MTNNFSLYLALRYLRPKRTFVSIITLISVMGVSLGVAVLIVVIAVMAGFHAKIKELAMGYDAHIEAADQYGSSMLSSQQRPPDVQEKSWREVIKIITATPGVVSASPIVRGMLLVESKEGNVAPALMWGLKQDDGNRLMKKHENLIVSGSLDLREDNIIIDEAIARAWDVRVGDKITVYAPSNLKDIVSTIREIDD
ncbi:MAG: ABC transporter permease, partial [Verrucomicrobiaceae bacterium]